MVCRHNHRHIRSSLWQNVRTEIQDPGCRSKHAHTHNKTSGSAHLPTSSPKSMAQRSLPDNALTWAPSYLQSSKYAGASIHTSSITYQTKPGFASKLRRPRSTSSWDQVICKRLSLSKSEV